jgi:hypothetical protein
VALVVLVAASAYLVVDKSAESHGALPVDLARTAIQDQDNEIAARSNQRRAKIKSIAKV